MSKDGYRAVRWLRRRPHERRGGNVRADDGFTREGPTLAALADEYLEHMRIRNRTPVAVQNRYKELKVFLAWTEERDLLEPEQITRSILESYQRWTWAYRKKNGRPLGISTQRGRLGAVMLFFAWLCRQHRLEANPASEIELPRPEKKLTIEALSIRQVEAVLSQPNIGDPLGIRDRAILELFYSTGIRRSELARLDLGDLNRDKRLLRIRQGKGRKDRVVPVGARAMDWMEKYLEDVRPLLMVKAEQQALFLSGYGEPFNADVLDVISSFSSYGFSPDLALKPDVIHTVNWGAGLTSFINQAETRGLFEQSLVMMTTGLLSQAEILPKGVAFSGRGYHLQYPDPDKYAPSRDYLRSYKAKFNSLPDYTGSFMAQAFYGLKAAIEKAVKAKNGGWPSNEEIGAAMEGLAFDTPRGQVLVRKDHEGINDAMWGLTSGKKNAEFGYPVLDDFRVFPAADILPPEGTKTIEWIAPIRAQASIAIGNSGTIPMYRITRSPFSTPSERRTLANLHTS